MKLYWQIFMFVATTTIKENLCVPAIRPLSQRGIIFPEDNWDDCFLDNASKQPGKCKLLEECPSILEKWTKEKKAPKTCYFIKTDQYVCCPLNKVKENSLISNIKSKDERIVTTKKPFNIFIEILTTEPTTFTQKTKISAEENLTGITEKPKNTSANNNILTNLINSVFPINLTTSTSTTEKSSDNTNFSENSNFPLANNITLKPQFINNIFLQKLTTTTDKILDIKKDNDLNTKDRADFLLNSDSSTKKPSPFQLPPIFSTEIVAKPKRPSALECDLHTDINGLPSPLAKEFPFMASIGWNIEGFKSIWYACGGVLISPSFVLTAAHCVDIEGDSPSYVYLKSNNNVTTYSDEDAIKIKKIIKHPDFIYTKVSNDIALIELEREVNNPVACLWTETDMPLSRLTSVGFSHNTFVGLNPNELVKPLFNLVDNIECQQSYDEDKSIKIDNPKGILCAGIVEDIGTSCHVDSGSPLIMEFDRVQYVVGVAVINLVCRNDIPTIYTKIPSYVDWIEAIVWPEIDVRID